MEHVIARIREPRWAAEYRADPAKIGIVGHSFGGFVGASVTLKDQGISCYAHLANSDQVVEGRALRRASAERRDQATKNIESQMVSSGGREWQRI